jgi:hypothetical protein
MMPCKIFFVSFFGVEKLDSVRRVWLHGWTIGETGATRF